MNTRVERYDNLDDLNKGLHHLETELGRKIIDVKLFSFTQLTQEGLPVNVPVFYVHHEKGIFKV